LFSILMEALAVSLMLYPKSRLFFTSIFCVIPYAATNPKVNLLWLTRVLLYQVRVLLWSALKSTRRRLSEWQCYERLAAPRRRLMFYSDLLLLREV
jgi:hypothetical protein